MAENVNGTGNNFRACINLPPRVGSRTPWLSLSDFHMVPVNALPVLQMQMCVIFFGTLFFHTILRRVGIPRFTSMCIVGVLLSTTFNNAWTSTVHKIFFYDSQENLGLLSIFGYMFFLFYTGVKTDMSTIHRSRRSAINIGAIAILAPYLCGMCVLQLYSAKILDPMQTRKLGTIIGFMSFTTFPVISSVLNDMKILNSELGRLAQSSALVCEMFNVFLILMLQFTSVMSDKGLTIGLTALIAVVFFILLVVFILRPVMFWIIRQTPEGSPVSDHYVYFILIIALMMSYATHRFGFYVLLGPFVLGMAVPTGPPLGTAIISKIDTFVNVVLMPLFVTTCAMRVNLVNFMDWKDPENGGKIDSFMVQTLVAVVVTFVVKFIACMVPPLRRHVPVRDAACLALVMNCKGTVEMGAFSMIRDSVGIPDNVFSLLMMCIIVNATILPLFLDVLYDPMKKYAGYIKRNIVNIKRNAEFRVLTIIHTPDNIPPTINLLEAMYPTGEQPLCTFVLQLKELIGRASPIFICHKLQNKKKPNSNRSMTEKLLDAFESFEREFHGALLVNAYTAISPAEMMFDDICSLALDKYTSLIVLPFHRKWSPDGKSIKLEDESLRDLNYQVMERAPCSVGVLIERSQITDVFSPENPYKVCVLFIGGKDDRESLCFAVRMTKNPHVRLTVVRFLASIGHSEELQMMADTKQLEDVKVMSKLEGDSNRVKYLEVTVMGGVETITVIRSLVSEFDLIIVGRQAGIETPQTSGLLEWSEYPELGVLGDLLASTDAAGKASVFVIQQQRTAND